MTESLIDLAGLRVEAEEFLGAMLEATEQPMWVVDHHGLIRFANPAAIVALGYEHPDELTGRDSHTTIHYKHPDGSAFPPEECPMLRPRTTGETVASDQDWFVRRDGSMFPVSYVSAPIQMDEGRGAVVVFNDIEDRLRAEEELREHGAVLAAQQTSLRRVATLVAAGAPSADVLAAVAREVGEVVGLPMVAVWRFEADATATVLGAWSDRPHSFEVGSRWALDGPTICRRIRDTGQPARIDDFQALSGTIAEAARQSGIRSCAGAPIIVDGVLWGAMSTDSFDEAPLPEDVESRLTEFTELAAAAFSTTARQDELSRLADEQAALRRVATLVAREWSPAEVFAKVAEELARLLGTEAVGMLRFGPDGATLVAQSNTPWEPVPLGTCFALEGENVITAVHRARAATRFDDWSNATGPAAGMAHTLGIRSSVATPILVEGELWGTLIAVTRQAEPLPADTESRMGEFTELVATAISNAEARGELARLADEQAALRRVATLVAEERPPEEVFAAVAEEMGRVLKLEDTRMIRYEGDGTATVVASWGRLAAALPVGTRVSLDGDSVSALVMRTRRPVRIEDFTDAAGSFAAELRRLGVRSAVGAPIVAEGRLWGATSAASLQSDPIPADTEARMEQFTELVATAISNIEARSDLAASRARIVVAADDERRRVVRDLHDGAQQRLVHTVITLKLARRALEKQEDSGPSLLAEALQQAELATSELRELAHGILPAVLARGGLRTAVDALASRMSVPVENRVALDRLPTAVERTAYFVVAEALTNVAKHAYAKHAAVSARIEDDKLALEVRDDGVGGASPGGPGLLGLHDRLAALDGSLRVEGAPGGGTLLAAAIPLNASLSPLGPT